MFFFRARISGDVGSSGAAGIWLCPLHNSTHRPQTSSRNLLGGVAGYGWGDHPYGTSWARSSLLGCSRDAGEGQNSRWEWVPWQPQ